MPEKMTDTSSGMRKMTMYNMTKEKKNHPERMETQKYCKFCRKHTLHKETK